MKQPGYSGEKALCPVKLHQRHFLTENPAAHALKMPVLPAYRLLPEVLLICEDDHLLRHPAPPDEIYREDLHNILHGHHLSAPHHIRPDPVDQKVDIPEVSSFQQANDPIRVTDGGNLRSCNHNSLPAPAMAFLKPCSMPAGQSKST